MTDLRIIFLGTPDFAVGILEKLLTARKNIVGVITAPDKPAGRGQKMLPSAVKTFAIAQNLKVLQPENLKSADFIAEIKALKANLQIVVAFRMLPKIVWQMPEYGTFNLHASLLPEYRGAAPINWAIINEEEKTGVTTFFIDEKIDTGAVVLKKEVLISKNETAETLHDKLMAIGAQLVMDTVSLIERGNVPLQIQSAFGALKDAPKLTQENTRIDWNKTGKAIDAFVRGLFPHPVAWTHLQIGNDELKMKVYRTRFENVDVSLPSGTIISTKSDLKIVVKDGYVFIEELQLPGKRKMDIKSFLNGFIFSEDAKLL